MSMGVKGVRGVPGKLLPPIEEGVLGMEPERLRGGLKSDMGVGGADLDGEPILLGASGELSCLPSSRPSSCIGKGEAAGEVGARADVGAAVPVLLSSPSWAFERAGDGAALSSSGAASPTAPPGGGMDDMFGFRTRKADAQYTRPLSWFYALARLGM